MCTLEESRRRGVMITRLLRASLRCSRVAHAPRATSHSYPCAQKIRHVQLNKRALVTSATVSGTMGSPETETDQLAPSPVPGNIGPKDATKYKSLAVLKQYTAPPGFNTSRVIDALQNLFPGTFPSVTAAKKATRKGLVLVDDDVVNTTTELSAEQTIKYLTRVIPRPALDASAAPAKLEVAYEDDHIAAVVKPQGMPTITMGKRKPGQPSASECIKFFLTMPAIPGVLRWPQHAHRLDAETGGLLICAKTTPALRHLSAAFAARSMIKRYRALVRGRLRGCGRVTFPLSGDACETEFRSVKVHPSTKCDHVTLVDLWPRTGRTHQLRRHMMMIGHPILGDAKYWQRAPVPRAQQLRGLHEIAEADLAAAPSRERGVLELPEAAADVAEAQADVAEPQEGAEECDAAGGTSAHAPEVTSDIRDDPATGSGAGACPTEAGADAAVGTKRAREDGSGDGGGVCVGEDAESGQGRRWGRCEQEAAMGERMCLWKVECKVLHPTTGEIVHMETQTPELFDAVLRAHAPAQ